MSSSGALHIHLAGSVPLPDAEASMRTVSTAIGPHLRRMPDGEPGARRRWAGMLREVLEHHRSFEPDPEEPALSRQFPDGRISRDVRRLRFRAGVDPQACHLETGYAAMAIDSFVIFDCLQRDGIIGPEVKFQFAMPTPLAAACNYISRAHRAAFLDLFTDHLVGEVQQIAAALPHERIAIQWDLLHELLINAGVFADWSDRSAERIATVISRIGEAVPQPIELGFHLSFGGSPQEPLLTPQDAAVVVATMRETLRQVRRPVDYFCFPVLPEHADTAYYAPLATFSVPSGTALYVGLAQLDDEEGNKRRLRIACEQLPVAGVSSAWPWGRHHPSQVSALLDSLRRLVA